MCGPFRHFESPRVLSCTVACLPYLAMVLGLSELYCSLAKERPWAEHLTSLPKIGTLLSVLHLTREEYREQRLSKQNPFLWPVPWLSIKFHMPPQLLFFGCHCWYVT